MEELEVEKLLKESSEKIKMKEFSERWDKISEKIQTVSGCEQKEVVQSAVLATTANENFQTNTVKRKIIYSVCGLFLIIVLCLAIVLPVMLAKNEAPKLYAVKDLKRVSVSESEFDSAIAESDLSITDLSEYNKDIYALLYNSDNVLFGGSLELTDDELGIYTLLVFYKNNIISDFTVGEEYIESEVNGYKIKYKTVFADDSYTTKAIAEKGNMVYELDCLALENNIESFFEKLFG